MARALAVTMGVLTMSAAACTPRVAPPDDALSAEKLADLSLPLDIREYEVANVDRARSVFIKLSRLPDAVEHHAESPASIVLDIKGPTGGDTPEETYAGRDPLVMRVRVARMHGILRVTLDLDQDTVPAYSVHVMADWIMVRLGEGAISRRSDEARPGSGVPAAG